MYSLGFALCGRVIFSVYQARPLLSIEGHLTTKRFILEPVEITQWAMLLLKGLLLVMPGNEGVKFSLEQQLERDKEKSTELKGHTISIPLDLIAGFELVRNLGMPQFTRLRFSDEGRQATNTDEFVFMPGYSKSVTISYGEQVSERLRAGGLGRIFAELGNEWLRKCREGQVRSVEPRVASLALPF